MSITTGVYNIAIGEGAAQHLGTESYTTSIGRGAQPTRDHEIVVATEYGYIVGEWLRGSEPVRPHGDAPRLRSLTWRLGARLMVWASR